MDYKILNTIWDDSDLGVLHLISLLSFKKYHPDWSVNIFKLSGRTINPHRLDFKLNHYLEQVGSIINGDNILNNIPPHIDKYQWLKFFIVSNFCGVFMDMTMIFRKNIENLDLQMDKILFYSDDNGKIKIDDSILICQTQTTKSFFQNIFENYSTDPSYDINQEQNNCFLLDSKKYYKLDVDLYNTNHKPLNDIDLFAIKWNSQNSLTYIRTFRTISDDNCLIDTLIRPYVTTHIHSQPLVSIVMAYHNRKKQLIHTLTTIEKSSYKNIEVIIVDDSSNEHERLEDIINNFSFIIKLIYINSDWMNPCVNYNIGFAHAKGDIIIIQNPEVSHYGGDIIDYCVKNITDNYYITFPVINMKTYENNEILYQNPSDISLDKLLNLINFKDYSWYNHFLFRPNAFHFLGCITRNNLKKIGGFDERYRYGHSFDDDEFVTRIKLISRVVIAPELYYGIHLKHDNDSADIDKLQYHFQNIKKLVNINRSLFNTSKITNPYVSITPREGDYSINTNNFFPKIVVFGSTGMLGKYIKTYFKNYTQIIEINRDIFDVETDDFSKLENILKPILETPTIVINCIGLIPQKANLENIDKYVKVNTIFPNKLSNFIGEYVDSKFIHITTDCVYSGDRGLYNENDVADASDIYGISKYLGEPKQHTTIIRTSIIGEELIHKKSLLEWVKSQNDNTITGYTNCYWNGVTCLELSKIIRKIIQERLYWKGVRHIFSPDVVSKYQLVNLINSTYNLNVSVKEGLYPKDKSDKSLTTIHQQLFTIPPLGEQLKELKFFSLE